MSDSLIEELIGKKVSIWLLDNQAPRTQRTWYEGVFINEKLQGFLKIVAKIGDTETQTYWIRESLISEIQVL